MKMKKIKILNKKTSITIVLNYRTIVLKNRTKI